MRQVRKEHALGKYWSRRQQGLPETQYNEEGVSKARRQRDRMLVLVGTDDAYQPTQRDQLEQPDSSSSDSGRETSTRRRRKHKRGRKSRRKRHRKHKRGRGSPGAKRAVGEAGAPAEYETYVVYKRHDLTQGRSTAARRPRKQAAQEQHEHGTFDGGDGDAEVSGDKMQRHGAAPTRTSTHRTRPYRRHSTVAESEAETDVDAGTQGARGMLVQRGVLATVATPVCGSLTCGFPERAGHHVDTSPNDGEDVDTEYADDEYGDEEFESDSEQSA